MRVVNKWTVIGAVLCAAGCGSSATPNESSEQNEQAEHAAHDGHAQHGQSGMAAPASTAGKAAMQAAEPARGASGNRASAASSTMSAAPKAGSPAMPAQAAGAGGNMAMASAGTSAGAAGEPAAGSGGSAGAAAVATEKFSFFVTSLQGMRDLSKSENGFGGDLRHGESTGLQGADKICTELAELSMPGAGAKGWHAFLSAAKSGEDGGPVHAKDRIGKGPWYDRLGRLVAMNLDDLLKERPAGADPAIIDDLPNERGEPNHTDTVPEMDDNHDVVTATNAQGMWDGKMTCEDWTSTETPMDMMQQEPMMMGPWGNIPDDGPGLGHSWPSEFSGASWISAHRAPGCGASVALVQTGAGMGTGIGNAGGYGGIYCFAMMP